MADYGHSIEVGIFPTPQAARPGHAAELAEVADLSGIDIVSIQDHPYQARHLDTWTLLTHLAARTTSVRVAPNVANLPLRQPVVLARSVATLDLLSGGRAELGLGAGAFWDAIVAAGGPRRTPRQAVDALAEAITIIRGVWAGGSLTVEGEHYRVKGLHAGPTPAHPVPIWLGAYKPRMLALTGREADAWIPSMGYADPPALPAMSARIDEAAERAGRGPEQIKRMYNIVGRFGTGAEFLQGTPADWAEQLADLACTEGISTFILGTDSPDDVRRFGDEVAPLLRDLVDAERSHGAGSRATADAPAAREAAAVTSAAPAPEAGALTVRATPDGPRRADKEALARLGWNESARPTAAVPADARYTPAQQGASQHLVDIHDALRSELDQVRSVVRQVRDGRLSLATARSTINTMALRQNDWTLGAFCAEYCRIVASHHTLEDRSVFTHLRRRDPGLVPVLDQLEREHHIIADVLDRLDRALVGLIDDEAAGSAALDTVEHEVDLLSDTLLSHLSYEERELLHPLAQHGFY